MKYSARVLLASLLLCAPVLSTLSAPSVTIDAGIVVGTVTSLPFVPVKVNKFLGIPFAEPPKGNRRFAPPVPPKLWSKPFKATANAPSCIQQFSYPKAERFVKKLAFNTPGPPAGESEDCLYINIFAPRTSGGNKTVMFWIYGGFLDFGFNSAPKYDGSSFAANQDVILVAPNYRTNVFGFPRSPQLPLEQRNLGFLDQRLALSWVQKNIHAFGGDPTKVTIFGESAGARSVDDLITTMPDNPPFRAAIMQSGQATSYKLENSNTSAWDTLMSKLNCYGNNSEILSCARAAKVHTIKALAEKLALAFRPVSDNITQLEFGDAARATGNIAKVPILTGTNGQEGRIFAIAQSNVTAFLHSKIPDQPPSFYEAVLAAYPKGAPGLKNGFQIIGQIATDFWFQCRCAALANSSSSQASIPTWRYYFNATFPNTQFPLFDLDLGAYHSSEISIVFGTYPILGFTEREVRLSKYMQTTWADFAKYPLSGPGFREWPNVAVMGTAEKALESDTNAGMLDAKCPLYKPLYQEADRHVRPKTYDR